MDVPVYPVCPKEFLEKYFPADEPESDFVSQPIALVLSFETRFVNSSIVLS